MENRSLNNNKKQTIKKIIFILIAILVYAINVKTFIHSANLISSGIMGLSIFTQRVIKDFLELNVPLTLVTVIYNIIPVTIAVIIVGKKFTFLSCIILFSMTFVSDLLPTISVTEDSLLAAVFGGVLNGFSLGYILRLGLCSGGTDFISIAVAKKFHKPIFNYVMIFNILLVCLQGIVYDFEKAFYSIIFQFVTTQMINYLYRHFEKRTLFVITEKPKEISKAVIENTEHSVTKIEAVGAFTEHNKSLLYLIVTEPELKFILEIINKTDKNAFINVMKSTEVSGNFHYLPIGT